jgi:hypothetical protein
MELVPGCVQTVFEEERRSLDKAWHVVFIMLMALVPRFDKYYLRGKAGPMRNRSKIALA